MITPSIFWSPKNDPDISPDNTGRDPLGLQPIWSGSGRMIVPHFASGISRYEGLLAVLLGYEIADQLSLNLKQTRKFFYTWEALVEAQWHFHKNSTVKRYVIYGTRFFANGLDCENLLPKNTKNVLTFRKGLWLFYRGTLRRMDLLTQKLKLQENNRIEWPEDALQQLVTFFEQHYINKQTIKLKDAVTKLNERLEQCWRHKIAMQCLMNSLYQGESNKLCYQWTVMCGQSTELRDDVSWRTVDLNLLNVPDISSDESANTIILKRRLTLLRNIDPWLAVLDGIADWLDGQDQSSKDELTSQLRVFCEQKLVIESAKNFPAVTDVENEIVSDKIGSIGSNMYKRWGVLTGLAHCLESKKWAEFIQRVVHYHQSITAPEKRRWRLDSNQLLCNQSRQNNPLNLDIKVSSLSYQSYYLKAAWRIHKQLEGALK